MPEWLIEGHAIVSAEGSIADAEGRFPPGLGDPADWLRFQAELDRAAAVVLGRASHEAAPNVANRLRVVMSRSASGLTRGDDAWWWNPARVPVPEMLSAVAPGGGLIAVPGGQGAFDFFLRHGFDAFHLVRNPACRVPSGRGVFSGVPPLRPEDLLRDARLAPGAPEVLTPETGVVVTVWRPRGG